MKNALSTPDVVKVLLSQTPETLTASKEVYRALYESKLLAFDYDEQLRVVEVHSFGITKKGELAVRCFQVSGESSQPLPGWRMFRLDKFANPRVLATPSAAPRDGFKANDSHLAHILLEILK